MAPIDPLEPMVKVAAWKQSISIKARESMNGVPIKPLSLAYRRKTTYSQMTLTGDIQEWTEEEWLSKEEYTWLVLSSK